MAAVPVRPRVVCDADDPRSRLHSGTERDTSLLALALQ